ncbi:MFS transporter [Paenibacillus thermotolerans]|uniref:MFS transporter n=1 Tax=Paenibacillus thermotolerans TaxID=3027807 RepID=UPI0023675E82|nr:MULTISPECIES: MFS transporter [unclassified Paenibacillus]
METAKARMEHPIQPAAKEKLWTKNFVLLALANGLMFFGFQMLLTTLPVYVQNMGGSNTEVGWIIGMFTIVALIARPIAGWALDAYPKKQVLIFGLAFCLLAIGLYGFAAAVLLVLLVRMIHGFGFGFATTTYGTIVADIIPSSRRGEGMGYFGLAGTFSMIVGPLSGLEIMDRYGFGPLFAVSLASTAAALALTFAVQEPGRSGEGHAGALPEVPAAPVTGWRRFIEPTALFPSLLMLLIMSGYGGVVTFITLYGEERALENVGLFFSTNAVCLFLIRPISGRLFDRLGHVWVLLPCAVAGFIGILLLSYTTSTYMLIASAVFFGIAFGGIQPSLQAWVINRAPAHRRGTANATLFSSIDLGIGGGAILLGPIADTFGSFAVMYRASSVLFLAFIGVYLIYTFKRR